MPRFGDFNFNDDTPGPDTDPVPERPPQPAKIGEPFEDDQFSIIDGLQNDVANYAEPGEGEDFNGSLISIFDVQSNPEEPGAQEDHIPPVVQSIRPGQLPSADYSKYLYPRSHIYFGGLSEKLADLRQHIEDTAAANKDWLAGINLPNTEGGWGDLFARLFKTATYEEAGEAPETFVDRLIAKLAIEQDAISAANQSFVDSLPVQDPSADLYNRIFGYIDPEEIAEHNQAWVDRLKEPDTTGGWGDLYDRIFNPVYEETDYTPDPGSLAEKALNYLPLGYQIHESGDNTIWLQSSMDAILDWLDDDNIDVLLDTDDAESERNPTGIGELFDENVIAGFDAFGTSDLLQFSGTTNVEIPTADLPIGGIEELESADFLNLVQSALGTDDLNDYLTDLVLFSDLIEFNNMGESALGDADGVL